MVIEKFQSIEYSFINKQHISKAPKILYFSSAFLSIAQIVFIILFAVFANYNQTGNDTNGNTYSSNCK